MKKENEELKEKLENKIQETCLKIPEEFASFANVNRDHSINENEQNCDDNVIVENLSLPGNKDALNNSEPIIKLEKRFKETMEKVAELTDEKQKLEHLVLQLQGETETIGKLYIQSKN